MGGELTAADFPLIVKGNLVYRRTESSPMLTASTPAVAENVAYWLNESVGVVMRRLAPKEI